MEGVFITQTHVNILGKNLFWFTCTEVGTRFFLVALSIFALLDHVVNTIAMLLNMTNEGLNVRWGLSKESRILYILWERTAHPVVLNWDAFLCSVCCACILHYLSVCIIVDRTGGERRLNFRRRGVLSVLRGYIFFWAVGASWIRIRIHTCKYRIK